ncbi:related to PCF11 component of pre-mRNA 3`-end processing factor CF I [Sporisorium reilianum SRZ2]|uniref:Related to PCF11 component of pre-mRNA 3`-end processing factor CF I n=1 Tax=Sporisorium reilianum (strain SRZ2) TaxID=999809 RepID=E6ZN74_SPORE|nr:related to PCF11 component of pre-mRNA 3`-end processing factor CF I [Sporisorium reilianum SRZ2]
MYGAPQPGYGAPPPQPQYGYAQQHPQPPAAAAPVDIGTDPVAFASMYNSHLKSLTFNSKPIITNLTVIAHDHAARMATVVAKTIDDHIMQSHPSLRLPALYTLDSISKNIGHPYTQLWAARIVPVFLESYRLVDQPTKLRMEELLATWKTAGPGARALFGDNAQWSIERALFGSQGMPQPHAAAAAAVADPRANAARSKSKAIENIDRLLAVDGQSLAANPSDQALHERVDSLAQLKQVILTADLSTEEMAQIHAQLDSLSAAAQRSNPSGHAAAMHGQPLPAQVSAPAAAIPQGLSGALANLSALAAPASNGTNNNAASSLIASLMQAGLLPGSSTPTTAAATPPPALERDQDEDYIAAILALDIKTSGPEFSREPAASYELILHKHLPLQCRQCANRYPTGGKGQGRMDDHLDWHFTQNRRAKDSAARGQSRSWFDRLDSFIRGGFDDAASAARGGAAHAPDKDAKTALSAAHDKALRAQFAKTFVVAPADAALASQPCPICKEAFKSQWSEDEEEWIWLNAMRVDAHDGAEGGVVYYHASCHYSARSLTDSVAGGAERRTASVGVKRRSASRTATPTAGPGGRKRKSGVEGVDEEEDVEGDAPPGKRAAV